MLVPDFFGPNMNVIADSSSRRRVAEAVAGNDRVTTYLAERAAQKADGEYSAFSGHRGFFSLGYMHR